MKQNLRDLLSALSAYRPPHIQQGLVADSGGQGGRHVFQKSSYLITKALYKMEYSTLEQAYGLLDASLRVPRDLKKVSEIEEYQRY